jgi:hypothetical protein
MIFFGLNQWRIFYLKIIIPENTLYVIDCFGFEEKPKKPPKHLARNISKSWWRLIFVYIFLSHICLHIHICLYIFVYIYCFNIWDLGNRGHFPEPFEISFILLLSTKPVVWPQSLEITKIMAEKTSNENYFWNLFWCLNIWDLGKRRHSPEPFETYFSFWCWVLSLWCDR